MELTSNTIDAAIEKLRKLDRATYNSILLRVGRKVGVKGEELVGGYPAASGKPLAVWYTRQRKDGSSYQSKFKSDRQEGWFFWALSTGEIQVPYRRTGGLGASLTSGAVQSGDTTIISIGSNKEYAPFVWGEVDVEQSHYHTGTWTPLVDTLTEGIDQLAATAEDELDDSVSAYFD